MREGERFLHEKYSNPDSLQQSEEVESAVHRQEAKTEEKLPNTPEARIGAYLSRLEEILNTEDEEQRKFRLDFVKEQVLDASIPLRGLEPEEVPNSTFDLDRRVAREQGHGNVEITPEMKSQILESSVKDQEASLGAWFEYLSSKDAIYPTWLKYWTLRSVASLSDFDKEKHEFRKRSKYTRSAFPDINREALSYVLDAVEKKYVKGEPVQADDPEFQKLIKGANFGKLYAHAIEKCTPATQEQKEKVAGQWVKYDQGSDAEPLYKSLQGHGTGWCTAGEATAKAQLGQGDFYVFYSEDKKGKPNVPRVAIRMQNGEIAEVRGINADQNMESAMADVAKDKMKELPGAEKYEKKSQDMKLLTAIENKIKKGKTLAKDELTFLYEMDFSIDGFGYQKDPRIEEIRAQRKLEKDLPIIFECQPSQIAYGKEQIKQDTIAYIGEWTPEVLNFLPENIKYIYEEFPNEKVFMRIIETDPGIKSAEDAEIVLGQKGFKFSGYAKKMLEKTVFSGEKQKYEVVSFPVKALGFAHSAKYGDIIAKAKEFGLELCPAELGPQLRLQYKDQPNNENLRVGMEPITDSDGFLDAFSLRRDEGELWLDNDVGNPGNVWDSGFRFLFVRPRK